MLSQPAWITFKHTNLRRIQFVWDDARADEDFAGDASIVLSAALKMSVRARMVLAVAMYEWVIWRFAGLHDREEPVLVLEAAWCATVDPRYLVDLDQEREDWLGPVEGPLWCAAAFLEHGLPKGYDLEGDLYDSLELVYLLAVHVLEEQSGFEAWLKVILPRFVDAFPLRQDDIYEDLFDQRIGERLGPLIGRETLDPSSEVDENRDRVFLAAVLANAAASENPYLATPEDLAREQFSGRPYVLPPAEL